MSRIEAGLLSGEAGVERLVAVGRAGPGMGLFPGAREVKQQLVAEPRAGDLQPERQAVREAAGRERQRRMAGGVLDRGVEHLPGQRPDLVVRGHPPLGQPARARDRG